MNSNESKRDFVESLRERLSPDEFANLVRCLDPSLGYGQELPADRLRSISPERLAVWEQERAEFQERLQGEQQRAAWCDPFIDRLPPPRRPDLDVDDVTDLLKYIYASLSRAIAELQYYLAELTGTGRLDPEANEYLQFQWCYEFWEFLSANSIRAVRNEHACDDWDYDIHDNTYSTGLQVTSRVTVEPLEIADDQYPYNQHLCGDGPIQEYSRGAIFHIAEPRCFRSKGDL